MSARNLSQVGRAKVAVLRTSPGTVVEDIGRAMDMAEYQKFIQPQDVVHLKINISWHHYYPACSTTPWQLEGVTKKLLEDGFLRRNLRYTHNQTVVVDPKPANVNNHLESVSLKYGIPYATTIAGAMAMSHGVVALMENRLSVKALQDYNEG